ncbi:MAG TPA: hypothetical protein VK656_03085, partial [Candidatus Acidoferrum sp.]|nr:hypothetical protein [Candidatus Acidoferrum sp.]
MSEPLDRVDDQRSLPATAPIVFAARTRLRTGDVARIGLIAACLVAIAVSAAVVSGASSSPAADGVGAAPTATASTGA